jgi:NADH dehydrogenase
VIGAGFGGLTAAKALGRVPVQVTVVDRKNHHTFQPLLYQVATAGLSPGNIASPVRRILRHDRNEEVLMAEVTGFDLQNRRVLLNAEDHLSYDYLIIGAGATHSYFGHNEWEQYAPGLKTIEDALEIRRRVLLAFEKAEAAARLRGEHEMVNFVVVGGGPTGVELAGTLAEISRRVLVKDFRTIDPRRTRILLIEAGPRILATYPEDLSRSAEQQLRRLGVEVMNSAHVTRVEANGVWVGDKFIAAAVILWAAGVAASPLGDKLGCPVDRAGRVLVNPDLSIPEHPEVFVIGDMASLTQDGKPLPGVAQVAIQQGQHAAEDISRDIHHQPRIAFHYHDKGSLATIGRAAAVADLGRIKLTGFTAWVTWLVVHIWSLIGFRNRILVLIQWAFAYFTYDRAVRLITGSTELTSMKAKREQSREQPGKAA